MIQTINEHPLAHGRGLDRIRWLASNGGRPPPSLKQASSTDAAPARPATILIVEDDWFIATDIRNLVTAAGYQVIDIATTADEAVSMAVEGRPDLVLMDIRLVGQKDGIDAALAIREQADIPCLMVSAHKDAQLQARAAAARPRGWLMKPFSGHQLLSAIDTALKNDLAG